MRWLETPDTDIFIILLYLAHTIKLTVCLDTGAGKHRQLFNLPDITKSLGEDYAPLFWRSMCSAERSAPVHSMKKKESGSPEKAGEELQAS